MTDRQIEVMERILKALERVDYFLNGGHEFVLLREFELIIKEQKELNLNEFKNKQ